MIRSFLSRSALSRAKIPVLSWPHSEHCGRPILFWLVPLISHRLRCTLNEPPLSCLLFFKFDVARFSWWLTFLDSYEPDRGKLSTRLFASNRLLLEDLSFLLKLVSSISLLPILPFPVVVIWHCLCHRPDVPKPGRLLGFDLRDVLGTKGEFIPHHLRDHTSSDQMPWRLRSRF